MAYLVAHPLSAADFRHRPPAIVELGLHGLVTATGGPLLEDIADLMASAVNEECG